MPRFTVVVRDEGKTWYFHWSTIVDGAVSLTDKREEHVQFLIYGGGQRSPDEAEAETMRAEEHGTSRPNHGTPEEVFGFIMDGGNYPQPISLTPKEAIAHYLKKKSG